MQDKIKKILVIYLNDDNKQTIAYTNSIQYIEGFVVFITNENKLTIPANRILKIKEDLDNVLGN